MVVLLNELTVGNVVLVTCSISAILIIKELHLFMDHRLEQEFSLDRLLA